MKKNLVSFPLCLALFFAIFEVTQAVDIDLGTVNASFWGEEIDDQSGLTTVSIVGDANGDGYSDIMIGVQHNDYNGGGCGQAYLIFGKTSGWYMDIDLSNADASFVGEAAGDYAGHSVAGAGDVNNDGYDDILISAHENDYSATNAGQVYVILGKSSGWHMRTPLDSSDASFVAEAAEDNAGNPCSGAGDVNNDGFDDILVGAYLNDEGGANAGQVYLILGKAAGWAMRTPLSNSDASFIGEAAGDEAGSICRDAGDVNGDGYDDILIAAVWNDEGGGNAGQDYLILGRSTPQWQMDMQLSDPAVAIASFIGEAAGDYCGMAGSAAGDVNGDGLDDLLLSGHGNDAGGASAGQSYLIFGKQAGWGRDVNLANADASFIGEHAGDQSGISICGGGDVNKDGYDDILVGAWYNDDAHPNAGKAYLILGKPTGWSMDIPLTNSDAFFFGENEGDAATGVGEAVSITGDVNADGYDDILIGAPYNDEPGNNAGQTYLIYSHKIESILDAGNDQGNQVRVVWYPSMFDGASVTPITQYGIWRRADQYKGSLPGEGFVIKEAESFDKMLRNITNCEYGDRYLITTTDDVWDFIAAVPAMQFSEYSYVAPTLADSTYEGMYWSVFFVSGMTADPLVYFDSDPDSGYSLDNIPPLPILDLEIDPNSWFTLRWTVPGEYEGEEPISSYDFRYSTEPVGIDTQTWWDNAQACTGEGFFNLTVGEKDSFRVAGETGCHPELYFAIKGLDDRPNASGISNVVHFLCGDDNGDGIVNVGDVVYEVSYLFRNGPAPSPRAAGDVNCDGIENVGDIVYKVSYLYRGGRPPCGQ